LVRRNNEFHHFDVLGTAGVITDASGAVLSTNVYDAFGVARYVSGNAQTQWRWLQAEEEGLVQANRGDYLPQWGVVLQQQRGDLDEDMCQKQYDLCLKEAQDWYDTLKQVLLTVCGVGGGGVLARCFGLCSKFITPPTFAACELACMAIVGLGCYGAWKWLRREWIARNQKCLEDYEECMRRARKKKAKYSAYAAGAVG